MVCLWFRLLLSPVASLSPLLSVCWTLPLYSVFTVTNTKNRVIAVYYMVSHRCRQKPNSDPGSALHVLNSRAPLGPPQSFHSSWTHWLCISSGCEINMRHGWCKHQGNIFSRHYCQRFKYVGLQFCFVLFFAKTKNRNSQITDVRLVLSNAEVVYVGFSLWHYSKVSVYEGLHSTLDLLAAGAQVCLFYLLLLILSSACWVLSIQHWVAPPAS